MWEWMPKLGKRACRRGEADLSGSEKGACRRGGGGCLKLAEGVAVVGLDFVGCLFVVGVVALRCCIYCPYFVLPMVSWRAPLFYRCGGLLCSIVVFV